ncbi:hypothetical protein JCM39068_07700 [Desulfocastanea catecholica]
MATIFIFHTCRLKGYDDTGFYIGDTIHKKEDRIPEIKMPRVQLLSSRYGGEAAHGGGEEDI